MKQEKVLLVFWLTLFAVLFDFSYHKNTPHAVLKSSSKQCTSCKRKNQYEVVFGVADNLLMILGIQLIGSVKGFMVKPAINHRTKELGHMLCYDQLE